jgi:Uncharacterized protein conserved in bacteria
MFSISQFSFFQVIHDSWQLASQAFADESKSYRRKQKWKCLVHALANPGFASEWFAFIKSSDFEVIFSNRPQLYIKPFRVYMSTRWSKKQKVKVILDTYRYIRSKEKFLQVITKNRLVLAKFNLNDAIEGELALGYDYKYRKEGELILSFACEQLGGVIAAAAFSFEEINPGQWVCRIGCVQGHQKKDSYPAKTAQKLLHGLRPKSLVVFTIQEFARQLGMVAIYGTGDAIQAYRCKHAIYIPIFHSIQFDYDALWEESGGQLLDDGWYELPLVAVQKEPIEIKTSKRALYQRKYSMLDNLSLKITDTVKTIDSEI